MPKPIASLLDLLPLDQAMGKLVVDAPVGGEAGDLVERIVQDPAVGPDSHLAAALWLYVDDLHRSHRISQQHDDATGAFWHGIMHRREGDFGNSMYWLRKAGDHPAMATVGGDYSAARLVDAVEAATQRGETPYELVHLQRCEWRALFVYCAGA